MTLPTEEQYKMLNTVLEGSDLEGVISFDRKGNGRVAVYAGEYYEVDETSVITDLILLLKKFSSLADEYEREDAVIEICEMLESSVKSTKHDNVQNSQASEIDKPQVVVRKKKQ